MEIKFNFLVYIKTVKYMRLQWAEIGCERQEMLTDFGEGTHRSSLEAEWFNIVAILVIVDI